jgi:hypothetical protein
MEKISGATQTCWFARKELLREENAFRFYYLTIASHLANLPL